MSVFLDHSSLSTAVRKCRLHPRGTKIECRVIQTVRKVGCYPREEFWAPRPSHISYDWILIHRGDEFLRVYHSFFLQTIYFYSLQIFNLSHEHVMLNTIYWYASIYYRIFNIVINKETTISVTKLQLIVRIFQFRILSFT